MIKENLVSCQAGRGSCQADRGKHVSFVFNFRIPSQIIFACLAALAAAAPQFQEEYRPDYRPIAILRDERQDYGDGNFRYEFETENGILVNAEGAPGSQGQSNIRGFFRWVFGRTSNK